ncbi:MAG: beta-galactosidase [Chloroflexota bacterium]
MVRWRLVATLLIGFSLLGFAGPYVEVSPHRLPSRVTVTAVQRIDSNLNPSDNGRATFLANGKPFFPIGVTYHFTRQRETWDDDLRRMSQLGLNTVRIDLAWRDIVPYYEGSYEFGCLDDFLDKAAEYGLYVVPVFSYATSDYNTPIWFWLRYHDWAMVGADGSWAWGDYPSVNHPDYARLFSDYIRETVRHISQHPAILAYQVLNEPHYPQQLISDYNAHTVAGFRGWAAQQYSSVDLLNATWLTNFGSFNDVEPPSVLTASNGTGDQKQWQDWREFAYANLGSYVEDLAGIIREEDRNQHMVLVAEMSWWWWGEQPATGVSPSRIYQGADIVGYDVYPEGGKHAEYFTLNSDLLTRLWQRPVWVTELNRKDGNPTSAEIQSFTARAVRGGATGIFYFEWRDTWTDGGTYGLLDARGNEKKQFAAFADAVNWLRRSASQMIAKTLDQPDVYIVWPSESINTSSGPASPADDIYRAALRLARQGQQVGLLPEDQVPDHPTGPGAPEIIVVPGSHSQ